MTKSKHCCPGCGRPRAACWHLPCLYLEQVLARGLKAINRWLGPAGMRAVPRGGNEVRP